MAKIKLIIFTAVLSGFVYANSAYACSVCFGVAENNSSLTAALKISVLSLLAILIGVLGIFTWFFVQMARRSKNGCLSR